MPLETGQVLSHYRLVDKIGEGGMGVVWRAEDTKLGREVALKFLPRSVAADPQRLARFQREARTLAALSDSNVGAIFEMEEAAGEQFLVLEYVPGVSLAERLKKGALPIEETLRIACDLARGLEAAHAKGMIHRDLKPANVQITPEGKIKVLDFGLAKALGDVVAADDRSQQMTVTAATGEYTVVGTVPYMSPEQASGQAVDRRTDIWAFGCILYELLAGRRAFPGDTTSNTLAMIQARDPDWERLPATTPAGIRQVLRRCLDKDPDRRLHDVADARIEIEDVRSGRDPDVTAGARSGETTRYGWRGVGIVALALALGLAAGLALRPWLVTTPGKADQTVAAEPIHLSIDATGHAGTIRIAPDGRTIAWNIARDLYWRSVDRPVNHLVGPVVFNSFAFSPDGRTLAFAAPEASASTSRQLFKIDVKPGAVPVAVTEWPSEASGMAWLSGGDIVAGTRLLESEETVRHLLLFPEEGGALRRLEVRGGVPLADIIQWSPLGELPQGRGLLAAVYRSSALVSETVEAIDLETGQAAILLDSGSGATWSSTGDLVYSLGDRLLAAPFDIDDLAFSGSPRAVASEMGTGPRGNARFALSRNGTLVYRPGGQTGADRRLVVVDRTGDIEVWSDDRVGFHGHIVASADGSRVAGAVWDDVAKTYQMWVGDTAGRRLKRLTTPPSRSWGCFYPLFSPDASRVAYTCTLSDGAGGFTYDVYERRFDGTDEPRRLFDDGAPISYSPDGSLLLLQQTLMRWNILLMAMPPDAGTEPASKLLLEQPPGSESWPMFSPDGRWIAYNSSELDRQDVCVRRFRENGTLGPRIQISKDGGSFGIWGRSDGPGDYELCYQTNQGYRVIVSLHEGAELTVSEPRRVPGWDARDFRSLLAQILPDGRLLAVERGAAEKVSRLDVIVNFDTRLTATE